MVGLIDVAKLTLTVDVQAADGSPAQIEVHGVQIDGIKDLFVRFPEVADAFAGNAPSVEDLLNCGPEVIGAIIAAGVGKSGDGETETMARGYQITLQVELVEAILQATLPDGTGPLAAAFKRMGKTLGAKVQETPGAPAMKSRKPSKP